MESVFIESLFHVYRVREAWEWSHLEHSSCDRHCRFSELAVVRVTSLEFFCDHLTVQEVCDHLTVQEVIEGVTGPLSCVSIPCDVVHTLPTIVSQYGGSPVSQEASTIKYLCVGTLRACVLGPECVDMFHGEPMRAL